MPSRFEAVYANAKIDGETVVLEFVGAESELLEVALRLMQFDIVAEKISRERPRSLHR